MTPTSKLSTARKICCLLTSAERRSAVALLGLMFIGMGLAKQVKVKILQASTSEVYGDPQVHPQTEDLWGHVNPVGLRSYYDEGKRRCAETLFFDYRRQHQLRIKVARIAYRVWQAKVWRDEREQTFKAPRALLQPLEKDFS